MGYIMAIIKCDDCGNKSQITMCHKTCAPGTKLDDACWTCPDRNDNGWAIQHKHTVMSENEDQACLLMSATCDECGHERPVYDASPCKLGTKLRLDCWNDNSGHTHQVRPHTVVANGGKS